MDEVTTEQARTVSLLRDVVIRQFIFDVGEFRWFMYQRMNDEEREALMAYAASQKWEVTADNEDEACADALEHMFEDVGGDIMNGTAGMYPTTHEIDVMRRDGTFDESMQAQTDSYDFCTEWVQRDPVREAC
jgi:hypothetical protein